MGRESKARFTTPATAATAAFRALGSRKVFSIYVIVGSTKDVCSSVHKYDHPGGPGHSLCGTGKNNLLEHFLETLELLLAGLLIILASSTKLHVACKLAIWD